MRRSGRGAAHGKRGNAARAPPAPRPAPRAARSGAVSCKRLWQIGMEHAPLGEDDGASGGGGGYGGYGGGWGYADDESPAPPHAAGAGGAGLCSWLQREDAPVALRAGATGIWVGVFGEGGAAGQVLLSISRLQREMPPAEGPGGGGEVPAGGGGGGGGQARASTLKVSACQAYDHLLMAGLRAQARAAGAGAGRARGRGGWAGGGQRAAGGADRAPRGAREARARARA